MKKGRTNVHAVIPAVGPALSGVEVDAVGIMKPNLENR
jgi:hypothetical protein